MVFTEVGSMRLDREMEKVGSSGITESSMRVVGGRAKSTVRGHGRVLRATVTKGSGKKVVSTAKALTGTKPAPTKANFSTP